jgi:hypothetical protein
MKKLLVVLLAMAMTLALATCAAAAGSVYIDRIWEGDENESGANWNGTFIGGGMLINKFKFGAEYGTGLLGASTDMTLFNIKGGYRVVENNGTMLDVVLVYLSLAGTNDAIPGGDALESTAMMIGLDFTQYFSKDFLISLQYNYSLSADTSAWGITGPSYIDVGDNTITVLRAKATYFFSEMVGASLGYQSLIIDTKDYDTIRDFSALSLGVVFRFM